MRADGAAGERAWARSFPGSLSELPFADEQFDLTYGFKVLPHVADIDAAIREAMRVTRPGGHLLPEFYNPWSVRHLAKRPAGPAPTSATRTEADVHTRWDSPGAIRRLVPPETWPGATLAGGVTSRAVAPARVTSPNRDVLVEAKDLRQQVLHAALLIAVVAGGLAFARTVIDAIERDAWRVVGEAVVMYAGFVALLFARRLPYKVRALSFLGLLYVVGVVALLSVGYLAAPVLVLAGQSVLASVLFGRRVTLIALAMNMLALLGVGAALSTGIATVETTAFYEPSLFVNWLRVTAIFAVFCGIAVVSVDVITNHLNQSLRDQAELIENLKGAMQLRDESERQRRAAESRLRDASKRAED